MFTTISNLDLSKINGGNDASGASRDPSTYPLDQVTMHPNGQTASRVTAQGCHIFNQEQLRIGERQFDPTKLRGGSNPLSGLGGRIGRAALDATTIGKPR